MALEDLTIDYPCPECKQKFEVGLYHLLLEWGLVVCPGCRATNIETLSEELKHRLVGLCKSL